MKFKDAYIHDLIEILANQYQYFIKNKFINYHLLNSNITKNDWIHEYLADLSKIMIIWIKLVNKLIEYNKNLKKL